MSAKLVAGVRSLHLVVDPPVERVKASGVLEYRNDIVGIKVWCSTVSGFTPSSANLVFDGVGLDVLISSLTDLSTPQAGITYYVKYALISEIDRTYITYSQEYSAVPISAAGIQTDIIYLYKWATNLPNTKPTGTGTYTWGTSQLNYTGTDWFSTVPLDDGTPGNKLFEYSIQITSTTGEPTYTITNWTNGSIREYSVTGNVLKTASIDLYKWSDATKPAIYGTIYYKWSDGTLINSSNQLQTPSGWTLEPSTSFISGQTLWKASTSIIDSVSATTTLIDFQKSDVYISGYAGIDAVVATLSNPSVTVYADYYGNNIDYTVASGKFTVLDGNVDVTNQCSFSVPTGGSSIAFTIDSSGNYAVTNLYVNSLSITVRAIYKTYVLDRIFSITKNKAPGIYNVIVESSNGLIFRVGQASETVLTAKVYLNDVDITDTVSSNRFKWRRVSTIPQPAPNDDATWNASHISGYKTISLNVDDVYARATFFCDISSE